MGNLLASTNTLDTLMADMRRSPEEPSTPSSIRRRLLSCLFLHQ